MKLGSTLSFDRLRRLRDRTLLIPTQEVIYRELFVRDLNRLGLTDDYYPVRGAASHGLMYLITRAFVEFQIKSVIEFGGGQTTILLDRLQSAQDAAFAATTIEHDPLWAGILSSKVQHSVIISEVSRSESSGRTFYNSQDVPSGPFDLIIVDGPPAHAGGHQSDRLGFADVLPNLIGEDFIIVIDDAERSGELKLIREIRKCLHHFGYEYREGEATALKKQKVFCAGKFSACAFF